MTTAMNDNGLKWMFPSAGNGEEDGFNDPMLEYFEGDHEHYIAREAIQNAVDVRLDPSQPVRVVFERIVVPTDDLPGRNELAETIARCPEFVAKQPKAEAFFVAALKVLKNQTMSVLKISDFNTTGLSGTDDDRTGNWYRLVRATGASSMKGVGGGSFGIGKGAPIVASSLRTVFYSSVQEGGGAVFQGKARLVSHYDAKHDVRRGVGFYGKDGVKAIREIELIPKWLRREERGTDIFVIAYEPAGDWRSKLVSSVLHNFWLAIHAGDLEVEIREQKKTPLLITASSLKKFLEDYDAEDARYFYEALINPTQTFKRELKSLGEVTLSIRKQDGFPYKIMMARKPKMRVMERLSHMLHEPFAGVFLCLDDKGNELLRQLEPPAHDRWDRNRQLLDGTDGSIAINELQNFVNASLRSMEEAVMSEPQDIPGLDKYLPDNEERDFLPESGEALEPTGKATEEETGIEIGASKEAIEAEVSSVTRRGVVSKKFTGKVRGAPPKGKDGKTGRKTGTEEGEDTGVRIRTSAIGFRSYAQNTDEGLEYHLIVTGNEDCDGAIKLVAVGDDVNYSIDVASAIDLRTKKAYPVSGALIKELAVKSGKSLHLVVRLVSDEKYSLGIENYES